MVQRMRTLSQENLTQYEMWLHCLKVEDLLWFRAVQDFGERGGGGGVVVTRLKKMSRV